jgi:hypothetical protein
VIEKIRQSENFNFELALAKKYREIGALPEAEQHYSAAGKEGTDRERRKALDEINTIRNDDNYNFDLTLAHKYRDLHAWEAAEQHYSDAGRMVPPAFDKPHWKRSKRADTKQDSTAGPISTGSQKR